MMRSLRPRSAGDESGFTLAELIVYSILMIVVLGLAGVLFIRIMTEQRDIKAMADANNEVQGVFERLELDLRNADWAEVDASGTLLVVKTRVATSPTVSSTYCVGYYYNTTDSSLHRIRTTNTTNTKTALDATTTSGRDSATSTWGVLIADVSPIGSTRIFGPNDALYSSPDTVTISLSANTIDSRKPIEFVKSVSLRPQSGLGNGCR